MAASSADSLPLSGLRVLEIGGGIPAAFATRWMAGFGADVVRSEPARSALSADETVYLLAGKRRVAAERLRELALAADIVVEDGAPGALAAQGLEPRELLRAKPALVVASITPFGQTGPYARYQSTNLVAHALGGILSLTGHPNRPPLCNGGSQAEYLGGLNAFGASLTAHFGALAHGEGDWLDLSLQECAAGMLELYGPRAAAEGEKSVRSGNQISATWGIYPCADGFAGVCALARQVPAFFELLGDAELRDERFTDPLQRLANNDELEARVWVWFSDKSKDQLLELGAKHRVPFGAVRTPRELLDSPGLRDRGFFDRVATPSGEARVPGRPFLGFEWRAGGLADPGAHTAEVATDWLGSGRTPSEERARSRPLSLPRRARSRPPSAVRRLPLEGVRVADLTMMWAGPYATRILGEMGAEVIKIESPGAWDNVRTLIPQPDEPQPWNTSYYFNDYNRDKKSLTLDLAQDAGRALFLDLVPHCDVVIENYRADVLDKLGLGYEVLRARRDDIVLVSMAGFGKSGPERDRVGFGPIIEQMAGLASMTGYGDGVPYKTGISYGDPVAGIAAAGAVGLALIQRMRTGRGCFVDLAQRETTAALIGEAFAAASLRGEDPVHWANRHPVHAPQGVYRSQGHDPEDDDEWIAISVRSHAEWRALAHCIGAGDLASLSAVERRERHDELDAAIEAWTRGKYSQLAMEELQRAGVPAGRVLDTMAVHDDPQLLARGFWVELPHPLRPPWKQPATSWRLVETNPQLRRPAPLFGEHNAEILCGLLGRTPADLEELRKAGVISDAPINPSVG